METIKAHPVKLLVHDDHDGLTKEIVVGVADNCLNAKMEKPGPRYVALWPNKEFFTLDPLVYNTEDDCVHLTTWACGGTVVGNENTPLSERLNLWNDRDRRRCEEYTHATHTEVRLASMEEVESLLNGNNDVEF